MAKKDRPSVTIDVRCAEGSVTVETDGRSAILQIRSLMGGSSVPVHLNALQAAAIADALNSALDVEEDDDADD